MKDIDSKDLLLISVAIYAVLLVGIVVSSVRSNVGLPLVAKCPIALGGFTSPPPTTAEGSALLLCGAGLIVFIVIPGAFSFGLLVFKLNS